MHNNPKVILVNFGCKNFSFEKVTVLHKLLLNPAE